MKKRTWIPWLLLVCLALPTLAAQENVVVPLPTVAPLPQVQVTPDDAALYSVENMASYYKLDLHGNPLEGQPQEMQFPGLWPEEKARLPAIQATYDAGQRPQESILNKVEDVRVGVYTLNPEDYEGQQHYLLLPIRALTDEELLQIIDAYAQLNLVFDGDSLSFRNCMRGGGVESSRFMQEDEQQRLALLASLYRRQSLKPDSPFTPLPGDDGVGEVGLYRDDYAGLESFRFTPYRPMTDEELLRMVAERAGGQEAAPSEYAQYERQMRAELQRLFNAPLALELTNEEMGYASDNSIFLDKVRVYKATFVLAGTLEKQYFAQLDIQSGKIIFAWPTADYQSYKRADLHMDPFAPQWQDKVREYITGIRQDGVGIAAIEPMGETNVQYLGYGALFAVIMEDGGYYEVTVPYQLEEVYGMYQYYAQRPRDLTKEEY